MIKIPALPNTVSFRAWKLAVRTVVASASGRGPKGFHWIQQVEDREATFEGLADPGKYESLDTKLTAGIAVILQGDLGRKITLETETCQDAHDAPWKTGTFHDL